MPEETKQVQNQTEVVANTGAVENRPGQFRGRGNRSGRPQNRPRRQQQDDEFDTKILDIRRVSRMYKGGRRMRMSVFVVVGDRSGRVGLGLGKGADISLAQTKATEKAKKALIMVPMKGSTIPHQTTVKYRSTKIVLRPAAPGTGLVAGATVKAVLEVAGVKDVLSKLLGSTNAVNAAYATLSAIKSLRSTRV